MKDLLIPLIALLILVGIVCGIGAYYEAEDERQHNGGYCQTCGGEVLPVGHQYHTDYYCRACKKYNK